jgi:hypothetical protein
MTKWYKSWTLWFNVICGTFETIQYLVGLNMISGVWIITIVTWGNIIIRILRTTDPITFKKIYGEVDFKTGKFK